MHVHVNALLVAVADEENPENPSRTFRSELFQEVRQVGGNKCLAASALQVAEALPSRSYSRCLKAFRLALPRFSDCA